MLQNWKHFGHHVGTQSILDFGFQTLGLRKLLNVMVAIEKNYQGENNGRLGWSAVLNKVVKRSSQENKI